MLTTEGWMEIRTLKAQGLSIRAIASATGLARNTVRKALRQQTPEPMRVAHRASSLDPFKGYLQQRYETFGLSATRLVEEIRAQGYRGSVYTVRRFLHTFRARESARARATVRFETPPGHQAQADWTYLGRFANRAGDRIPVYGFAMVLGFSRYLFACFTTSMKIKTLIDCHLRAFEFFGGCTSTVLYDNMKQVRLDREHWNPLFVDFTAYYGFTARTHRVRRPRTKGKIERTIGYVKEGFLVGRSFADLDDLNAQVRHWLDTTANVRIHATTNQRPIDLLAKETLLGTSAMAPYQVALKATRTVDAEGFVRLDRSRYSVPPEAVGALVLVETAGTRIRIHSEGLVIAEHPKAARPGLMVAAPEHVEAMWKMSVERTPEPVPRWQVRFDEGVEQRPLSAYEEVLP